MWLSELDVPAGVSLQLLNAAVDGKIIGMCGVIHTNWLRWVKAEQVSDFAYVFHWYTIESGFYVNVYGIRNAYFCRYELFLQTYKLIQ